MDNFRPKEGIFDYSRTLRTYMTMTIAVSQWVVFHQNVDHDLTCMYRSYYL